MHLLKLVTGQGLDDAAPVLWEQVGNEGKEYTSKNTLVAATSPSGVIGGNTVRGWSGASSLVKHQQSFHPSTRSISSRFADSNKLLSLFTVIGLILIFSNFSKMSGVSAMPRCPSGGIDNEEPVDCSYGVTTDYCGRKVCAKGPGQICGVGLFKLLGSCGEGLFCSCGRCTGCSLLTMECYDKTCV